MVLHELRRQTASMRPQAVRVHERKPLASCQAVRVLRGRALRRAATLSRQVDHARSWRVRVHINIVAGGVCTGTHAPTYDCEPYAPSAPARVCACHLCVQRSVPLPGHTLAVRCLCPRARDKSGVLHAEVRRNKAGSTLRSSRAVPHPSTNRALRRLTSEVGRDPVHSTRYGRQRRCIPCKCCLTNKPTSGPFGHQYGLAGGQGGI